jgi:hypothetical protein
MNRHYIRRNITTIAIVIYLMVFGAIVLLKPAFLYNRDGSLRQFGLNSTKRTVIPVWLMALLVAILSYLGVLYYLRG